MKVCVYCGSSTDVDRKYFVLAEDVGVRIGTGGHSLVYGGGICGLMGAVASAASDAGADVIGVYPNYFTKLAPPYLDEAIVTRGLRDRKEIMADHSDAFLALPGGLGTLDELFDILAPKSLHVHTHPIVLLNHEGYYDKLLGVLDDIIDAGFMRTEHRKLWHAANDVDDAFDYLEHYEADFEVGDLWPVPPELEE